MNCVVKSHLFLACVLLAGCSRTYENTLINGMTPELEALVIERSIEQIEFAENFTHDNFEEIQRKHLETMDAEMRDAALENLQTRLDKVRILDLSQTVQLDRESVNVDARIVDEKNIIALVTLQGTRSYRTDNASQTSETRFSLPWLITFDDGELVFRHRGIRMRDRAISRQTLSPNLLGAEDPPPAESDRSDSR